MLSEDQVVALSRLSHQCLVVLFFLPSCCINSLMYDYNFGTFQTVAITIGSLSNYDDDHNNDFKKTIGLMIKTTAQHVHHAF